MTATTDTQPEDLRNHMVDHIEAVGHLHSSRIEQVWTSLPLRAINLVPEPGRPELAATRPRRHRKVSNYPEAGRLWLVMRVPTNPTGTPLNPPPIYG